MKVFMSWSGVRSKVAAELLCDWTKCVIQASRPWISTRGIDRGALWFSEINNELKDTAVGIVCLTHENKDKPWILFEAGALAKGLSTSRVCTFLVDLQSKDLQDPLAQFNHTLPTRDGLWSLVVTLNSSLESGALDERILRDVFDTYWPKFEEKFSALLARYPQETVIEARPADLVLDEILDSTRAMAHRIRGLEERLPSMSDAATEAGKWRAKLSSSESRDMARDFVAAGFSEEMVREIMRQRGYGKFTAKQVLESANDLVAATYMAPKERTV